MQNVATGRVGPSGTGSGRLPELPADQGPQAEAKVLKWRGSVPSARAPVTAPSGAYRTEAASWVFRTSHRH